MAFYVPDSNKVALSREDLADHLRGYKAGLSSVDDSDRPAIESRHNEFKLTWKDGRSVVVKREKDDGRVAVEASDRKAYDRKAQGKLRRSFPEPREDLLGAEVARQVGLLYKALGPLFAQRKDQVEKAERESKAAREAAVALAEVLGNPGDRKRAGPAVLLDKDDPEVEFLLIDSSHGGVCDAKLEAGPRGVSFTLEFVSLEIAMVIARALRPHVALRVRCGHRGCSTGDYYPNHAGSLVRAEHRARKRCEVHAGDKPVESGEDS